MTKVLIVEDERAISNLIAVNLKREGYDCACAYDGEQAAMMIEANRYDLILLDIMLPKIDGYELMGFIREFKTPVIYLTAKDSVNDRIRGLKLGADDYIGKPFQIGELLARVEAVLRRAGRGESCVRVHGTEIDFESRTVFKDGMEIELTTKEFDLLEQLVRHKNTALRRSYLYEAVWQEPFDGETRTLDLHIQRLSGGICVPGCVVVRCDDGAQGAGRRLYIDCLRRAVCW